MSGARTVPRPARGVRRYFRTRVGARRRSCLRLLSIASFGLVGSLGSFLKPPGLESEMVSQKRSAAAFGSVPGGVAPPLLGGRCDELEPDICLSRRINPGDKLAAEQSKDKARQAQCGVGFQHPAVGAGGTLRVPFPTFILYVL
jgi:hypothetical protein